ncbi:hypothetical protein ACFL2X_03480 [Candidatus Latescibacterota bacterium]
MKKTILFYPILLLITAVLFSGCLVTSVHPLGNEDDIIFEENLIGMWDVDDDEYWLFTEGENKSYKLYIYGEGEKGEYNANLIKLLDKLFLDIYPDRLDTGNIVTDVLMLPTHTFLRFSLDDSGLGLEFTDPEWFTDRIDRNEDIGIEYLITEDEVITLTAPTEKLQAFYLSHADDDEFFDLDDEKLQKNPDSAETIEYLKYEKKLNERLKNNELQSNEQLGKEIYDKAIKEYEKLNQQKLVPPKPLEQKKDKIIRVPVEPQKREFPPEIMELKEPITPEKPVK